MSLPENSLLRYSFYGRRAHFKAQSKRMAYIENKNKGVGVLSGADGIYSFSLKIFNLVFLASTST